MGRAAPLRRRALLGAAAATAAPWLGGCAPDPAALPPARWIGDSAERGHRLREPVAQPADAVARRADVVVVGGGIAGLAAARALARAGVGDLAVLELEDAPGGNSRGHAIAGMACPLGAHYLPLPGRHADEVVELLEEWGLAREQGGRLVADERHQCHSPQERLFIDGAWHEGLLPPPAALPARERAATRDQYRRFAGLVAEAGRGEAFRIPTSRAPWTPALAALDGESFAAWLDRHRLDAPALRWLLNYACRDDYGADAAQVSAWAGLHYFASRHGFRAPDEADDGGADAVLTWPEGNAWLARRLALPFADRIHAARIVARIEEGRQGFTIDAWHAAGGPPERWSARAVVIAVPLFVAARMLASPPAALPVAVGALRHAPWLVANLHVDPLPAERPGIALAWDNVAYGADDLGYVDAMHQSTRAFPGPTVFTAYRALGGPDTGALAANRRALLASSADEAARRVLADLARMHPDLAPRVRRIDLMRYGHAMAVPAPGVRGSPALAALAAHEGRLHFGHADLSGYSVFEEALHHGLRAGAAAARALRLR